MDGVIFGVSSIMWICFWAGITSVFFEFLHKYIEEPKLALKKGIIKYFGLIGLKVWSFILWGTFALLVILSLGLSVYFIYLPMLNFLFNLLGYPPYTGS